jgi:sulfite exporter TauE/SafE
MWYTALVLGFAGSLHCLGMCSPLVIAVTHTSPHAAFRRIVYNAGRIGMYGMVGGTIAFAGSGIIFDKFQNIISILIGLSLLIVAISGISAFHIPVLSNIMTRFTGWIKHLFGKFLQQKSYPSTFFLGALNGLLPCGLTLFAFSYTLTLRGFIDGFNFMLLFGAGTLPVMLGFTGMFQWVIQHSKINLKHLTTSLMICAGILLIARTFIIHAPDHHSTLSQAVDIILCR